MATKLKNMRLTSVDLVRAGANQDADICLYKSADPEDATREPTDHEMGLLQRFVEWLKKTPENGPQIEKETPPQEAPQEPQQDNPTEEPQNIPQNDNDAQSFEDFKNHPNDTLDLYFAALEDSIESIQTDDDLDEEKKNEVMIESFGEFVEAMKDLIPSLCATKPSFESDDTPEETEKSCNTRKAEVDTIEEVEKFNQHHDNMGRFSSGGGGGAAPSAAGAGKFDAKSAEKTINQISSRRNNGGATKDDWKQVRDILQSAPVGTVLTQTGNRGSQFQHTKTGKDEWKGSWDSDTKTLSMGWAGNSTPISVKFSNRNTAPTEREVSSSQIRAVNGRLDQALRGAAAQ